MNVDLVLQPAAHRSRSMVLYAERLAANQPSGQTWQIRRLPTLPGNVGYRVAEMLLAPPAVRTLSGDVLHVVDHAHAAYARYARKPVVVTVHDLIPLKWMLGEYPTSLRISRMAALWFRWNMRGLHFANRLVTPSRATADALKRLLNLEATVVPNGVDDVFFETEQPSEKLLPEVSGPILLQVSSGFFYKNDAMFRQVFLNLADDIKNLTWVRVGSPLSDEDREALAAHRLADRAVVLAGLTAAEMAALYRRADCLLFPSLDEGFGWPPLEAMAAGCPVVAATSGALAETAVPAALTAEAQDGPRLTSHVRRILGDPPLAADLVARGRAHAATFPWTRTAAHLADIYAETAR